MKALSAPVLAALAAREVALVTLVKLEFPSGTICLHSGSWPELVHAGDTYRGAYGLGTISPIEDSAGELPGIQLELQRGDPSFINLALDDADEVQGAQVTISTAIFDPATFTVLHVEIDWTGYADTMAISEDGQGCSIVVSCESKGVDLIGGNPLMYADGDQQSLVPGDRFFEYVADQDGTPVVWPAREFFYQ